MKIKGIILKTVDSFLYLGVALIWIGLFSSILGCVIFAFLSRWEMFAYSFMVFCVSFFLFIAFMIDQKDPGCYHYDEYL